jgi:hypothetical protein
MPVIDALPTPEAAQVVAPLAAGDPSIITPDSSPESETPAGPAAIEPIDSAAASDDPEPLGPAPIATGDLDPAPHRTPIREPSDAWLARHWRGELSLPTSYWINGLGLLLVVYLVSLFIGKTVTPIEEPLPLVAFFAAYWLSLLTLQIWLWVGVWRSAGRTARETGSSFWPIAARGAVLLGVLKTLSTLISGDMGLDRVKAVIDSANELKRLPFKVTVLQDGSEIEVSGGIGTGLNAAFLQALNANSKARVVHLNSTGGSVSEAKKLRAVIRERHLITYTSTECSSACTIAFLGGESRLLKRGGKLGFHRPTFPALRGSPLEAKVQEEENALVADGVDAAFAHKAMLTPNTTFWYPLPSELLAARVITAETTGDEFGMAGVKGRISEKELEAGILELPLYRALLSHEPDIYKQLVAIMNNAARKGASISEMRSQTVPLISKVIKARVAFASDEAVLAFVRLMIDQETELQAESPELCFAYAFPSAGQGPPVGTGHFSAATLSREQAVMEQVISTADMGMRPPTEKEVSPYLKRAIGIMQRSLGSDARLLAEMGSAEKLAAMDRAAGCRVLIGYYKAVLALPSHDAVKVARYLFSANT